MSIKSNPIGVFDSGVGGISVLREAVKKLPNENFIYYGDSKNAPYGEKSVDEVKKLTFNVVEKLIDKNVKAIVIACNTATSAAINDVREKYGKVMPIIGIEPALKPAIELDREGKVIIMATPLTLQEEKFNSLMKKYEKVADIAPLPCPGLAEIVEEGEVRGKVIHEYLEDKLNKYKREKIAAIVLGCTHYPFVADEILNIISRNVPIIDGSDGTVRQLKRKLQYSDIVNDNKEQGKVEIINSLNENMVDLSLKLLNLKHSQLKK